MQCRQVGEKPQISSSGAGCRVEDRGVAGWWGEGGGVGEAGGVVVVSLVGGEGR